MSQFFIILEVQGTPFAGDKHDMALWIGTAMNAASLGTNRNIEATVYDSLGDLLADNVLDALAAAHTD